MAASSKQTSRWGSFLQQAVAGVESRLDTILAEGDEAVAAPKKPTTPTPATSATKSEGVSRTASTSNKPNDRLQERLARAIAAKNNAQRSDSRPDSLALSSGVPSRTGSPVTVNESPRQSIEVSISGTDGKDNRDKSLAPNDITFQQESTEGDVPRQQDIADTQSRPESRQNAHGLSSKELESLPRLSVESARSSVPRDSIDLIRHELPRSSTEIVSNEQPGNGSTVLRASTEYDSRLKQLQADFETSEIQRQEEIHGYIERIDALQSKLQYLAKESAEAARKASGSAPSGSLDKKLAEKEEQVALLMAEGQSLSKKELNHLTTIKKLRVKIQEDSKEVTEAKNKQEKAERDVTIMLERLRRAEASEKRLAESQKLITQLQKDIDSLKSEKDIKDATISNLKNDLEEAISEGKEAEAKIANEALELEKQRVKDLEEELSNMKIEKSLVADRAQAQVKELKEKMDKEAERVRIMELEMKNEQQMLESKLEVMRARAEEVSSGATGDAQAKLLRQIETLQTQYAVASENWQGIEASLIARATSLEKERDEAAKREADVRKKAREITMKAKRNEDELEETRSKLPTIQQELNEQKAKLDSLQKRADAAEAALIEAKASFEQEKQAWKSETQNRIDEERQKWHEDMTGPGSIGYNRADSPVASTRRGLTTEFLGLQNLQIRRASARSVNNDAPSSAGFLARRPSAQPLRNSSGNGTPTRQDSIQSLKVNGEVDATSIHTDHDDFFENNASPSSPHQTINDMVSVSTAGAGPSVQLVERMSSAVRRLETEKVATKEDLSRLAAQRDEARAEIVSLMREVEAKRAADARVTQLEAEIADINSRYETTLEMLGEKSEMVDELKSDIDDIKAMYRELVERTVK